MREKYSGQWRNGIICEGGVARRLSLVVNGGVFYTEQRASTVESTRLGGTRAFMERPRAIRRLAASLRWWAADFLRGHAHLVSFGPWRLHKPLFGQSLDLCNVIIVDDCKMHLLLTIVSLFVALSSSSLAILLTDQGVQCDPRQMHVFFDFADPFYGVVFVKGHQNDDTCRVYGTGDRRLSLSVILNIDPTRKPYCGVQLNKPAHEFSVQLLINSARDILVDDLSEFEVRCVYHLKDVTVKSPTVVGGIRILPAESNDRDLTVIQSAGAGQSPLMDMAVRLGHGITGQTVQTALIGQPITLDVYTDSTGGAYDFFLYNCLAHNGRNTASSSFTLLDSNGCAVVVDRVLAEPVQVSTGENGNKHVFLHLRGFQFSDSDVVYFECQVHPCLNECNTTQCLSNSSRASRLEYPKKWSTPFNVDSRGGKQARELADRSAVSVQAKVAVRSRRQLDQPLIVGASEVDDLRVAGEDVELLDIEDQEDNVCFPKTVILSMIFLFLLGCVILFAVSVRTWYKMHKEIDEKQQQDAPHASNVSPSLYL
uniref:ZP domain-containing protein n=1 Tax=Plectus sambesii TaxID=2011161 RepID=A0A914UT13_9BILA